MNKYWVGNYITPHAGVVVECASGRWILRYSMSQMLAVTERDYPHWLRSYRIQVPNTYLLLTGRPF